MYATADSPVKPDDGSKTEAIMAFEKNHSARKHGRALTYEDAVQILMRLRRQEYQHHIAADFGINQGRVSEIKNGHRFPEALCDPRLA
jgi:uncharacterized protein involved in type VI secretion and phage assembly